jgi:glycerol uptake facilitator-like aquaporin
LTIMVFVLRLWRSAGGGHFNPAVTIGVLAAGAMGAAEAIGYIIGQLVGGVIGALLLAAVLGGTATGLGTPALAHDLALVTVVLATVVAGRAGNLAPLAIGMTLTLNIMAGGPVTGAPFNPARALGPMIATGDLSNAWLYVAAPIVGALTAAIVHMGIAGLAAQPATAQARVPASSPAE